jgi:hypothetical protein
MESSWYIGVFLVGWVEIRATEMGRKGVELFACNSHTSTSLHLIYHGHRCRINSKISVLSFRLEDRGALSWKQLTTRDNDEGNGMG